MHKEGEGLDIRTLFRVDKTQKLFSISDSLHQLSDSCIC